MAGRFLNIFSRKKPIIKAKSKKAKIIIDYREKNSLIPLTLKEEGFGIEFQNLKVADYLVQGIAIERKTIADFISSTINKRLTKQLEELQQYEKRLLIIEGIDEQDLYSDEEPDKLGMHPNAIRGLLLSILLKHNVPIVYTKNYKDTIKFITILSRKKEREMPLNINKKNLTKKQRLQFILESFPGIGPKTSQKLLKKFKTLNNIFNASLEELKETIGKKAEVIKNLIDSNYKK
jgi:Fanconi anemia group M protein